MFGLRPPAPPAEIEFDIDVFTQNDWIFVEIEWDQERGNPERILLRFSPSETRDLISLLESQLKLRLTAA